MFVGYTLLKDTLPLSVIIFLPKRIPPTDHLTPPDAYPGRFQLVRLHFNVVRVIFPRSGYDVTTTMTSLLLRHHSALRHRSVLAQIILLQNPPQ